MEHAELKVYNTIGGNKIIKEDIDEEMELVKLCEQYGIPYEMVNNMLIDQRDLSKYARRKNIFMRLKSHIDKAVPA